MAKWPRTVSAKAGEGARYGLGVKPCRQSPPGGACTASIARDDEKQAINRSESISFITAIGARNAVVELSETLR
jgi:hypothetical protein